MSLDNSLPWRVPTPRPSSSIHRIASWCVAVFVLAAACRSTGPDDDGGGGGGDTATLSGTVRAAATQQVVSGAKVTIGAKQATTDANGNYAFTGLSVGTVTIKAERTGFLPVETQVTLAAGANTRDFTLTAVVVAEVAISGMVREAGTQQALAGVKVTLGAKSITTTTSGQFEFTGLSAGPTTIKAERSGFTTAEALVTLVAGSNTHNFSLSSLEQEVYLLGDDAAFVPVGGGVLRGAIIILGGPITSGFITGQRIGPEGNVVLEAALQTFGVQLRDLARSARVALIGRTTVGMINNELSDALLLSLLGTAAGTTGHPELANVPVLMFGLSSGSNEAGGFVSRNPTRSIGLLLRVPTAVTLLTTPAALAVPTFVMQAELDEVANNTTLQGFAATNRSLGGLWSLAVEPEVGHSVASNAGNVAGTTWLAEVLSLRLPLTPEAPLTALTESQGWLGNKTTLEIASWAAYTGDRATANWLLSQAIATSWQRLSNGTAGLRSKPPVQ